MNGRKFARLGFTLIELLVVIAIIGVLVALLLPAIQQAREAARRTQCLNNLKQYGLALQAYHADTGCLPIGRITFNPYGSILSGDPDTSWFVLLLPWLEQTGFADAFNYDVGVVGAVNYKVPFLIAGVNANYTVVQRNIALMNCPSDQPRPWHMNPAYGGGLGAILGPIAFTRCNYAVCWGNTNWGQIPQLPNYPDTSYPSGTVWLKSAFGHQIVRLRDFADGTSKSMVMSEVIQGNKFDLRGLAWTPLPGGGMYMTRYTPNGTTDYIVGATNLASGFGDAMPNDAPLFCVSEPPLLPCYSCESDERSFAGARSRHIGGVHIALGDGSARFVSDSVAFPIWLALGTIDNGDTVENY